MPPRKNFDPYVILELEKGASESDVQKAYKVGLERTHYGSSILGFWRVTVESVCDHLSLSFAEAVPQVASGQEQGQ